MILYVQVGYLGLWSGPLVAWVRPMSRVRPVVHEDILVEARANIWEVTQPSEV